MKLFQIILIGFSTSLFLVACKQDGEKTLSVKTEIYCDHCETCESCKARVESGVSSAEGVKSVNMKVSEEVIEVKYDAAVTDEQKIKLAIANTGFDAGDVKADPAAYDNLDDCCKKK